MIQQLRACTNSNFVVRGTRHISRATSAGGGGGAPDSTLPTRPEAEAESSSGSEPVAGACVSACSCDRMSHRLELARCGTTIGRISSTGAASVAMGVLRTVLGLDHVHGSASCRCQCHGASSRSTYLVFAECHGCHCILSEISNDHWHTVQMITGIPLPLECRSRRVSRDFGCCTAERHC